MTWPWPAPEALFNNNYYTLTPVQIHTVIVQLGLAAGGGRGRRRLAGEAGPRYAYYITIDIVFYPLDIIILR